MQHKHWPKYAALYILRLILVVLNDKNCIFRHKFYDNFSKTQFYENADENSIYESFVFHLIISTLRHVYSFVYDRSNWHDGIRYSYISFCARSASVSLVDFSFDIVASKKSFRQKLKVEFKFISAIFTFDKNMKSCIFANSGIISLVYPFVFDVYQLLSNGATKHLIMFVFLIFCVISIILERHIYIYIYV